MIQGFGSVALTGNLHGPDLVLEFRAQQDNQGRTGHQTNACFHIAHLNSRKNIYS